MGAIQEGEETDQDFEAGTEQSSGVVADDNSAMDVMTRNGYDGCNSAMALHTEIALSSRDDVVKAPHEGESDSGN